MGPFSDCGAVAGPGGGCGTAGVPPSGACFGSTGASDEVGRAADEMGCAEEADTTGDEDGEDEGALGAAGAALAVVAGAISTGDFASPLATSLVARSTRAVGAVS